MNKTLPLLSDSLRELLSTIATKYNNEIAKDILYADSIITNFNKISYRLSDNLCEIIMEKLSSIITDECRMLSVRFSEEESSEISFLPKDKSPEYNETGDWARKNRQTGKVARILQKLLVKTYKTYDWEVFTNYFKSEKCCCLEFKLVTGSDIRKYYCDDMYYKTSGTLGNSCMRYDACSSYFSLYEDHAKLLVSLKGGLVTGRALVWEVDGITLMDRIYTCFDYLENCFLEYAKDHKWWIRYNNSLLSTGDIQYWKTPDDNYNDYSDKEFRIYLDHIYETFPYVDSFRYLNSEKKYISTGPYNYDYSLDSTDGSYSETETWRCANCGATFISYGGETPDGMVYSEYSEDYYCEDCCWWCEYLSDWICNSDRPDTVHFIHHTEDLPLSFIHDNLVTCEEFGIKELPIVEINNKYYSLDDYPNIVWVEDHYELQSNTD